jgi:hypothetical protein
MPGAMVREVPPQRELPIDHTILRYNPWLQSRRSHPDQAFVGVWLAIAHGGAQREAARGFRR